VGLVLTPANERARVLAIKREDEPERIPTHEEVEEALIAEGLLTYRADTVDYRDPVMFGTTNGDERAKSADEEPRTKAELRRELERLTHPEFDEMQRATRREMFELMTDGLADTEPDAKALDMEHQAGPIQVRTFEC
jgi:hypothetical protein